MMKRAVLLHMAIVIHAILICACKQAPSVKVIARGAPIKGAFGINIDKRDRLYTASFREIVVMDPDSGKILERIGAEIGVEGVDDLAFGPDDLLYWTSPPTGEVSRIEQDDKKTVVAQGLPGVNPITFSDDGRLFVALRDSKAKGLYELYPDGAEPPREINKDLVALNAFDFGPDGKLYAPLFFEGKIISIDVDSGSTRTVAEGFKMPSAVKFDAKGRLFAVDYNQGKVFLVNPTYGEKIEYATIKPGLSNLVFDSQGRLFVSNDTGAIYQVHENGKVRIVSPGGFTNVAGIAVLPHADGESVYVPIIFGGIVEIDGSTGRQRSFKDTFDWVSPMHMLEMPMTLAADDDQLVIASLFGNAVQVWNPVTNAVSLEYTDTKYPTNAIPFQGDIVVAEIGSEQPRIVRISKANPASRTILAELNMPVGLAATSHDLWATDWAAGTVVQIVKGGQQLTVPAVVASGLQGPEGLAVAPDGSLLVVESLAGRLSRINSKNKTVSSIAENLELGSSELFGIPFGTFDGVAVGPSSAIYVGGDKANVVYRIK